MIIRNFYDSRLAQASYLVGCSITGEAIVIDPSRDVQGYIDTAQSLGLRITAVTETHIHADYLSGTRQLSAQIGARMYLSAQGTSDWHYGFLTDPLATAIRDGDSIQIGRISLKAMHTPGHTPEHMAFLLTDTPVSSIPNSLFAGDFVFVGDVGRPDLLERAANIAGTMEQGARDLHRSLQKLKDLPDSLLIWPGHGAGSACGKSLGGSPVTTLGYERASNWALLVADEDKFVDEILTGQPEPPYYFKEMKRLNKAGPAVLAAMPSPSRISTPLGQLIDIRWFDDVEKGSYDKAIDIPHCNSFAGWAGWMLRYDEPVTLISDSQQLANDAARDLAAIGLDSVGGWVHPLDLDPSDYAPIPMVSARDIDPDALLLDVRGSNERAMSRIKGSIHIPFGYLQDRLDEVPRDRKIIVYCGSGGRSRVAYSILRKGGFKNVQELRDGIEAVESEMPELISQGSMA